MSQSHLTVSVTGGAGQLAYQFLFRLGSGEVFGAGQKIALKILELPEALSTLEGVKMELQDCAFPLLESIQITSDPYEAFKDADYAIMIGSKPRGPGMERGDLLKENGKIFVLQGKALNEGAKENVKVFVVGNPCNTNCLIAMHHAPRLKRENFYAMTRLDQNRATFLLADKSQTSAAEVSNVTIWGNHSATQVPDFYHAKIKGIPTEALIKDSHWLQNDFISFVQQRGAAIIKARGKSSAASAAQAIIDAIQDTRKPTKQGNWFSSAIGSEKNPYKISENLVFSFPCVLEKSRIAIVPHLDLPPFLADRIKISEKELLEERDLVKEFIK